MEEERNDGKASITRMRIHVGGLGGSVMEDDLKKMFQSGGVVEAIDIIRTKGRSFAYVDFFPSSDNSLSKLFSTYNGCAWKGGRLRLEKAKEHYLGRLKREWEEDAQLVNNNDVDATRSELTPEKSKKLPASDDKQLRIFFPRLRKVKTLPFSGTGKHKYSFRRIEVPSLPVHFCDCEEHTTLASTVKAKNERKYDVEAERGGVDEEELQIMHSVMNKLFEKKKISASHPKQSRIVPLKEVNNSMTLTDDLQSNYENEMNDEADDDDLVLNVLTRGNNRSRDETTRIIPPKEGDNSVTLTDDLQSNYENEMNDEADDLELNVLTRGNNRSRDETSRIIPPKEGDNSMTLTDDLQSNENEMNDEADGDDLIINVVTRGSNRNKDERRGEADNDYNLISNVVISAKNKNRPAFIADKKKDPVLEIQDVHKGKKTTNIGNQHKKRKSISIEEADRNKLVPTISTDKLPHQTQSKDLQTDSAAQPVDNKYHQSTSQPTEALQSSRETETLCVVAEAAQPIKPIASSIKTGRGASWMHKASWTQLVGEGTDSSFSITQILPGIANENQIQVVPIVNFGNAFTEGGFSKSSRNHLVKQNKSKSAASSSTSLLIGKEGDGGRTTPDKNQISVTNTKDAPARKQTPTGDAMVGETCSFMRSETSLKEWAKTKAALSGSLKRKRGQD